MDELSPFIRSFQRQQPIWQSPEVVTLALEPETFYERSN